MHGSPNRKHDVPQVIRTEVENTTGGGSAEFMVAHAIVCYPEIDTEKIELFSARSRKLYIDVSLFVVCGYLSREKHNTLEVVPRVELERYLGKWYEVARLPFRFEDGCTDITATYALSKDGNVSVLNECFKDGKLKQAKGKAKVVDRNTGAKLRVTFFWPFYADYWIIDLGKDYDYAVVGTPNRKYLWILSRTPQMDDKLFSQLIESVKSKGFDVNNLVKTSHKAS